MTQPTKRVAIIGGGVAAAQCAHTLAQLGVEVSIITPYMELDPHSSPTGIRNFTSHELLRVRPLLLRTIGHPQVSFYTNSKVSIITWKKDKFVIKGNEYPRYVRQDLCTGCGRCAEECSIQAPFIYNGKWLTHSAIHRSVVGHNAVPSAYSIDKKDVAPCTARCPLNINVTGFVSLIAKGKVDSALSLINEKAPLAGVLGRVCTHPCEDSCTRSEVDKPVFIKALHRYAADYGGDIKYKRKAPANSRREKIGIVGSGPAGLAAAWELARRGYAPIIFESHAVVGGMLATGIPRFRLPREIREREVRAIEELGVEIRTGVTIGKDVTITDLRERGYRAFFLAIGAHENRKLNIPGEDLIGVVDSISLLFELNLRVGATVGKNMVVIGGGNSAVDSARTARRKGKRNVTILYRRTAEEMTAVKEDIEEALMEGISIQYLTQPVEILGDKGRVIAVRCQQMVMGEVGEDGRRRPQPVPNSEFVIDADHVVLAIGQQPNTAQLNKKNLEVNSKDSTVRVDPLTLQTSEPSVFAGGDCVTGPNSVVSAVAAGLQAAESIDRYVRGRSLTKNRSLEKPQPVEVDISERHVSPNKRAEMPLIPRSQRLGTFEETSTGLSQKVAEQEAGRCINCSLCSGCLECVQVCELGAVFHSESTRSIEVTANAIINFSSAKVGSEQGSLYWNPNQISDLSLEKQGIYTVQIGEETNIFNELATASSTAMEVASYLKLKGNELPTEPASRSNIEAQPVPIAETTTKQETRTGVILCSCGGSISSVIDFSKVSHSLETLPGVVSVHQLSQSCTLEGATQIASHAAAGQLNRIVIAACRCCNQDQICYSCTDRRVMCRQYLNQSIDLPSGTSLDYVNIREQCAWAHKNDPENATYKATEVISAMAVQGREPLSIAAKRHSVEQSVLVIGAGLCGLIAANSLVDQGYSVTIIPRIDKKASAGQYNKDYIKKRDALLRQLQEHGIYVTAWPASLNLNGFPGNYQAVLNHNSETECINAGAIILDMEGADNERSSPFSTLLGQNLLGRILSRRDEFRSPQSVDPNSLRGITLSNNTGIFVISSDATRPPDEQTKNGTAVAARVWVYLTTGTISPRDNAVTIDSRLCRGCGDCAAICPYIEMKTHEDGSLYACIEPVLCVGCGACIAHCPTGAISQLLQNDKQINVMLETILSRTKIAGGVG